METIKDKYLSLNKIGLAKSNMPPLGLLYIARSIEDEGHDVEVIDFYCESNPEDVLNCKLKSVDVVGLSVYNKTRQETNDISKKVKEYDSDIKVIIGGPQCTYLPEKTLSEIEKADICIEGEGELVIKDLILAFEGKKKLSDINGIYYKENNKIKKGKPAQVIMDLNTLHFPSRHLTENYDYGIMAGINFYKPKFTTMVSSRGCPFQCGFCSRHISMIEVYRERSIENVIEEIQQISEKYKSVMMVDDNFLANKKRSNKIMDEIIKIGTDIEIHIEGARVDSADIELYKKMKKANVKTIQFGFESGNQDVLDFYNKRITIDQIKKASKLANKMGFFIVGTFIFGAPIETEGHFKNTIKLANSIPLDVAIFIPLTYQYGSDMWIEAVKRGLIDKDEGFVVQADKKRGLSNFSFEELDRFCQNATNKFYIRPRFVIRQIFMAFRRNDSKFIKMIFNSFKDIYL